MSIVRCYIPKEPSLNHHCSSLRRWRCTWGADEDVERGWDARRRTLGFCQQAGPNLNRSFLIFSGLLTCVWWMMWNIKVTGCLSVSTANFMPYLWPDSVKTWGLAQCHDGRRGHGKTGLAQLTSSTLGNKNNIFARFPGLNSQFQTVFWWWKTGYMILTCNTGVVWTLARIVDEF